MKKRFTKIMAVLMATALVMSIAALSGVSYAAAGYNAINGTSTDFKKDVVVDSTANIPYESFSFTIESGTALPATSTTVAVHAGPNPNNVVIGSAVFGPNDSTISGSPSDSTDTTKKYAEKTVNVNFQNVTFNEPGIYRYLVKETAGTTAGMTYDNRTLSLDVYIIDNNGTLEVDEYVLHTGQDPVLSNETSGSDGTDAAKKVAGFVNSTTSHQIEFGKEVIGNQGSKDKYFAVKITLSANGNTIADNSTFPLDMTGAEMQPTPSPATNPAYTAEAMAEKNNLTVLTGNQLKAGHTFYLKDGQYIKILGLPDGVSYTLTETPEDYTQINGIDADASGNENKVYSDSTSGNLNRNIKTGFTNKKDGIVPTGVLLTIAPFAIGILVFGAIIFFVISKRRRDNY